jgi:hypothetical protein
MRTPGRIKNFIYHAHKFKKTIKKRGTDLYSAYPSKAFEHTAPSNREAYVIKKNTIIK